VRNSNLTITRDGVGRIGDLELVDERGRTLGAAEKIAVHVAPGYLHRAFSVFLFDNQARLLIQQRASTKYHWPGVWSNSCCGHPYPGEPPFAAAARRIYEELGIDPTMLMAAGTVTYRHVDAVSTLVEHEFNHLFVGTVNAQPTADPQEVAAYVFVDPVELARRQEKAPFSAWFSTVFAAVRPAVNKLTAPAGSW
jgi:isopentenyl-diphosphate delta-isomerase